MADPTEYPHNDSVKHEIAGEKYQCFTLSGTKDLINIYNEREHCFEQEAILEDALGLKLQKIAALEEIVKIKTESVDTLNFENNRLFLQWTEENKLRHEAEQKPQFGSWVAWGTAGVFVVTTAVLTGIVISDRL